MIGHVFESSGAVCLMLAPSVERPDEYIVLAKTETGYAVANLLTEALGRIGGPQYWLRGAYYDHHRESDADLLEAAQQFGRETGRDDIGTLVAHVNQALQIVEHRQHLATQDA